ncbi:MAG: glycosyltransferase [Paracoccaceae bacterium]|nr:glycosyltransferase [Paracoccaceae bacterium]
MPIDIVLSLNRGLMRPMVTLVNSIVANASQPEALRFNVAVPAVAEDVAAFERLADLRFPDRAFEIRFAPAALSPWIADYVAARRGKPLDPRIGQAMNYARFDVARLFPDLGTFLYLDADIVVLGDVAPLFAPGTLRRRLAAVPQLFTGLLYFRKPLVGWRAGMSMPRPFNAGVYLSDISAWGEALDRELVSIFDWDRRHGYKLFSLHTEPLMNLAFKDYQHLDKRWNASGYGNHPLVARLLKRPVEKISVLHWSGGHFKPWRDRSTAYADLWWRYDLGPLPEGL